jgi:uncharacterized membrane protein YphA (DoxX/SURF4 family)
LQFVLALVFLVFGANKFNPTSALWTTIFGKAGSHYWINVFAEIGIGQWFRYFTGAVEVVCAILLLIPKMSAVAALLLGCTMVGAILTHLIVLRDSSFVLTECVALLAFTCIVAWWRRPKLLRRKV